MGCYLSQPILSSVAKAVDLGAPCRFPGTEIWQGGRPGLTVDFKVVCDATLMVRNGSGETITDMAN